jgi:hypothetical protein
MIVRGNEPIVVIRRSAEEIDEYGNQTYSTSEFLIRDCLFAYTGSSEPVEVAREAVDARLTLYMPPGTEILDGDIFVIRESHWEKDGDSQEWPQLWEGFIPGVVVNVRRRRG